MKKNQKKSRGKMKETYRIVRLSEENYVAVGPDSEGFGGSRRIAKERAKSMAKYDENVGRFYFRDNKEATAIAKRLQGKTRDELKKKYENLLAEM